MSYLLLFLAFAAAAALLQYLARDLWDTSQRTLAAPQSGELVEVVAKGLAIPLGTAARSAPTNPNLKFWISAPRRIAQGTRDQFVVWCSSTSAPPITLSKNAVNSHVDVQKLVMEVAVDVSWAPMNLFKMTKQHALDRVAVRAAAGETGPTGVWMWTIESEPKARGTGTVTLRVTDCSGGTTASEIFSRKFEVRIYSKYFIRFLTLVLWALKTAAALAVWEAWKAWVRS